MEALYQALMQEGRVFGPVTRDLSAWREVQAERFAGQALALLRAFHDLAEAHGSPDVARLFLTFSAAQDRHVARALKEGDSPDSAGVFERLVGLLREEGIVELLGSPLFAATWLAGAWTVAAQDVPGREHETRAARELLDKVAAALVEAGKPKSRDPRVRAARERAAARFLFDRLPPAVRLLREQGKASAGLDDPSDILAELRRLRAENQRSYSLRAALVGAASGTITVNAGPRVPCRTCQNDRDVLAAKVLAHYRHEHADTPGPLPLREAAAVILLHRCPDRLDYAAARRALARLGDRGTRGAKR
ncbi:MAG: hypothetical protein EDX89_14365 [Acidobacteria bacterium]|nr:MAG: hypothetical protein EDX89_14365 [Acidobacteriota bacterium]